MNNKQGESSAAKGTLKRDFLIDIEISIQEKWKKENAFESNAPNDIEELERKEKFLCTFPYPYMNGKLHLGHAFTVSKAEFAAVYEKMKGKHVLFPFAFHCTGMPIKASADKLRDEMAKYGCPPILPVATDQDPESGSSIPSKHSKVAAKTGNVKLQWDILKQQGIPEDEIPKFADPLYWTKFFPPLATKHLSKFGCHIDWRRSFITTDQNPFYDSFIRWQFNKLKSQDKIKFGKRHTIFSPKDGQACLDHDRSSGEGVEAKEYVNVKLEVLEWSANMLDTKFAADCRVYLLASTLRPETMYGQTNCWVGPDVEYGAFKVDCSTIFVCTARSARNMSFQGIFAKEGTIDQISSFKGSELIGTLLSAPLSIISEIRVFPMFCVSSEMGTGIVTSVPSNAPADYVALADLKAKESLRQKFNIADNDVLSLDPIPIITSEAFGDLSAKKVVEQLKIKSQNDLLNLEKAKEIAYKDDFYNGIMLVGDFAGRSVQEAKNIIRDQLIREENAFIYFEPESKVISRSGDECVVALLDQWYIDYGEESWRALAEECVQEMETFSAEIKNQFMATLDWMKQWACSRSFGLGSKMPWDPQYLIESLSDSTIYMAYYTVAHIIHEGSLDASTAKFDSTLMTDEVWEWIFGEDGRCAEKISSISSIPTSLLESMKREFEFWYPFDLRVSGKDLVPNHLTFSVYNHVALFPKKYWPKGIRANGHLLLNSQKMSKSTGNFMTLQDSCAEFGTDATRFALADAGDSCEDANFLEDTANMAILRLFNQIEFFKDILASSNDLRCECPLTAFADKVFDAEINKAIVLTRSAYDATNYRDALKFGFFELQNARDRYRDVTVVHGSIGMNRKLLERFIKVQVLLLNPITPHFSEYVWMNILNCSSSINKELFPLANDVDEDLISSANYIQNVAHNLRISLQAEMKPKKKSKVIVPSIQPDAVKIFVAKTFPKWQEDAIQILQSHYNQSKMEFDPVTDIVEDLKILTASKPNKRLVPFVMEMKNIVQSEGPTAFNRVLKFDESSVLKDNIDYLSKTLDRVKIDVEFVDPSGLSDNNDQISKKKEASMPGSPSIYFYKDE